MQLYAALYHGTDVEFAQVDLDYCQSDGLEFGSGFYTTPELRIAKEYAQLAALESNSQIAKVLVFNFDVEQALLNLNIKVFPELDLEWFKYVFENRHGLINDADYDLVIGPLELSEAWEIFRAVEVGKLNTSEALAQLKTIQYSRQVVFKTEKSLEYLKRTEVIEVEVEQ